MGNDTDNFINAVANLSVAWHKLPSTGKGRRDHLRFGQYVINSDVLKGKIPSPWPELFYAEEYNAAYSMLYRYGLDVNVNDRDRANETVDIAQNDVMLTTA